MKRIFLLVLCLVLCVAAHGQRQQSGNTILKLFSGAPSGTCSSVMVAVNSATGDFYDCLASAWHLVAGGGGGPVTFDLIGSGTNVTATMTVGNGATLTFAAGGIVNASTINGVTVSGTPGLGQLPIATGPTGATWADPIMSGPDANGAAPTGNPLAFAGWDGTNLRRLKTDSAGVLQMNQAGGSVTLNTTSPLGGGGTVAFGGTLTFTCATCNTSNATVSSFSAGNLSPLFTSSVATATTTPALTFTLSNAAANTVFGNFTGSSAAPTFSASPVFSAASLTNFPTFNQSTSGNAATATALASTPTNCGPGVAAIGILANGNATGCFTPGGLANPMTTLGDIIYGAASGVPTRLPANSTSTLNFLTSISSSVPVWTPATIANIGAGTSSANYTLTGQNSITAYGVNNIVYIDGQKYATLQAYLASPSANTTVVVPANQTISSDLVISVAGLKITCENNATITMTATGRFQMQGDHDGFEGCTFAGPGSGVSGLQTVIFSGSNSFFRRNYVSGFGNIGGNGTIEIDGGSGHVVEDNWITGNGDHGIFVVNITGSTTIFSERIANNHIDTTGANLSTAEPILAHTNVASSNLNEIIIVGNILRGPKNFCVEVGAFGGALPNDIIISDNTCRLTQNSAAGGYSVAGNGANKVTINNNVFDSNGFTFTVGGIELAAATLDGTITGNTILGSTASTGANAILCSVSCQHLSITGNSINGFGTAASNVGIYLGTSTVSGLVTDNVIADNSISFAAAAAGRGIWIQCNATSSVCSNNIIGSNHISSDGTASSIGIILENDTGTTANNLIASNSIATAPATGISLNGAGVTSTAIRNGVNLAATPVSDTGTGTIWLDTRTCRLIADSSGSSSATLANVTWSNTCTFVVAASAVVIYECDVQSTSTNVAGGLFMGISGPATPVASNYALSQALSATTAGYHNISQTTSYSTTGAGVIGQTITTAWPAHFAGTFENGTTAGTLSFQFANGSATGSTVLKRGSFCSVGQQI